MVNNVTLGTRTYNLDDNVQFAAYLAALSNAVTNQVQTIHTLQNVPALTHVQFQQLLTILTPPAQRINQVWNPILSTPNGPDVPYQEVVPPQGIEDIAKFPTPNPFNGTDIDAIPFIDRLSAFFQAKPKAYRFIRARILFATSLLGHKDTKSWAEEVQ